MTPNVAVVEDDVILLKESETFRGLIKVKGSKVEPEGYKKRPTIFLGDDVITTTSSTIDSTCSKLKLSSDGDTGTCGLEVGGHDVPEAPEPTPEPTPEPSFRGVTV